MPRERERGDVPWHSTGPALSARYLNFRAAVADAVAFWNESSHEYGGTVDSHSVIIMISEERRIRFSKEALIEALRLAKNLGLPPGQIVELRAAPDGGCSLQIRTGDGATSNTNLSPSQMAAVFIAFARTKRIPVPRHAQKKLVADGDGIAMVIEIR